MRLADSRQAPAPSLKPILLLLGALGVVMLMFFLFRAAPPAGTPDAPVAMPDEFYRGAELAQTVCSSCHLYPEPALLDKVTWAMEVLPAMGQWLGFHPETPHELLDLHPRVREAKIMPEKPILNIEEWRAICTFYLAMAPVQAAPYPPRAEPKSGLPHFEVQEPAYRQLSLTTLVKIDEAERRIYVGEAETNTLSLLHADGTWLAQTVLDSPPVAMEIRPDGFYLTLIGSYSPSDEWEGQLLFVPKPRPGTPAPMQTLLADLPRPTDLWLADLNQNGREDIVMCGFGNILGRFSWFENRGAEGYVEHVLLDRAGAIKAYAHDFNRDGRLDLVVMMAQAREGIYLFLNQGGGEFEMTPLVEKHPAWGFSSFELVDFNGDGHMDLLATNGDNGDHTGHLPPFKSFHGIRLYLNDGKQNFTEAFFYPLNGAFKAVARDFDLDGKLDIAAISFYADYRNHPYEGFVYLHNRGNLAFDAYTFPESLTGRWITFDVGDLDGDGDLDIVLGAYKHGPTFVPQKLEEKWDEIGPSLLILKNTTRR